MFVIDDSEQMAAENTDDSNHGEKGGAPLREQDRFLPIANVAKIMKKAIPETGKANNKVIPSQTHHYQKQLQLTQIAKISIKLLC